MVVQYLARVAWELMPAGLLGSVCPSHDGPFLPPSADVVVIGSGIGGLSCASLLATYGYQVVVVESHYHAGGAAHSFEIDGFKVRD